MGDMRNITNYADTLMRFCIGYRSERGASVMYMSTGARI